MPENLLHKSRLRARSLDSVDLSNWEITNPEFAPGRAGGVSNLFQRTTFASASVSPPKTFAATDLLTSNQLAELIISRAMDIGKGAPMPIARAGVNGAPLNPIGLNASSASGDGPVSKPASTTVAQFKVGSDAPPNPYAAEIAHYAPLHGSKPDPFWSKVWIGRERAKARFVALFGGLWEPHTGDNFSHFLNNTGTPLDVDTPGFIHQDAAAKKRFYEDLNAAMSFIESTADDHNPLAGNIIQSDNSFVDAILDDWVGAVERTSWYAQAQKIEIHDQVLSMEFTVHQRDYYKWEEGSKRSFVGLVFGDLAQLHLLGAAQDFEQFGQFTTRVMWRRGQRPGTGANLTDAP